MTAQKMTRLGLAIVAAGLSPAMGSAASRAPAPDPTHAAVVQAISDCRKIAENAARLACFDQAASALDQAQAQGKVVVVDSDQVKAVRRQSFGFNIPSIALFSHSGKEDPMDKVTVELTGGHTGPDGRWRFTTVDDAVWRQTDSDELYNPPHQGSSMVIRKAALGSFFCKIDGQSAIRCVRER
jgi:hypothetical protein